LVSARVSSATSERAAELGIVDVVQENSGNKVAAISRLITSKGIDWTEAAFMGDDIPDVGVLQRVALGASPADGVAEARALAAVVTQSPGGGGAVREFCEWLLRARGQWDTVVGSYVTERGGRWP
jgi:3-deoxy-D-manno-octulosonate 8-phosphate phosphatase (KDO 8-P phosphatase)